MVCFLTGLAWVVVSISDVEHSQKFLDSTCLLPPLHMPGLPCPPWCCSVSQIRNKRSWWMWGSCDSSSRRCSPEDLPLYHLCHVCCIYCVCGKLEIRSLEDGWEFDTATEAVLQLLTSHLNGSLVHSQFPASCCCVPWEAAGGGWSGFVPADHMANQTWVPAFELDSPGCDGHVGGVNQQRKNLYHSFLFVCLCLLNKLKTR